MVRPRAYRRVELQKGNILGMMANFFEAGLIFAIKEGAYQSGEPYSFILMDKLRSYPTIIRLACKKIARGKHPSLFRLVVNVKKGFVFTISVMSSGFLFADTRYWNKKIYYLKRSSLLGIPYGMIACRKSNS
jgi:hypothetical protein